LRMTFKNETCLGNEAVTVAFDRDRWRHLAVLYTIQGGRN